MARALIPCMSIRYEITGCPLCHAEEARTISDADEIRTELEELWQFHTRRLRGDTPPRQLHDRIAFSQAPPLRVAQCCSCGLLYRNPRERGDALVELYSDEVPDSSVLETMLLNQLPAARRQARRLTEVRGGHGRGLEVGSYIGAFLRAAAEQGWEFHGVDVNGHANDFARAHGHNVVSGTIDDVKDGGYDAVTFWNCFDQLPDPAAAAQRARRLLRHGGILTIRVPSGSFYAAWKGRMHSAARPLARLLLAHNNLLGFPYRHGFTPGSLDMLLRAAGFETIRSIGDALVPVADRWTRPWARLEEVTLKTALRALPAHSAPWLELYARAR